MPPLDHRPPDRILVVDDDPGIAALLAMISGDADRLRWVLRNGTVRVESTVGVGTTITIELARNRQETVRFCGH